MEASYTNSTLERQDPILLSFSSLVFGIFQNLNLLLGLPLNVYVVICFRAGGLDGSVFFLLNQALNDFLFTLQAPLNMLCYFLNVCLMPPVLFFISSCLAFRFLLQCCVSLERYLAVVHPVAFRRYRDPKYRLILSMVIWTYSFTIGAAYTVYFRLMPFYIFGILQAVILTVMVFCCVSVWRVLRRPGPGVRRREDDKASAFKKRAFTIVYINLLAFLIQAIPLTVAFCSNEILSAPSLALALDISFQIYIMVGYAHTVLFLCQCGKLCRV